MPNLTTEKSTKGKKKKRQVFRLDDSSDSVSEAERLDVNGVATENDHCNVESTAQNIECSEEIEARTADEEEKDQILATRKPKKGKKAKEERRKARETTESSTAGPDVANIKCTVCGQDFPSKNKLFNHIKTEGHAALKNVSSHNEKKSKARYK
ncbi:hypothetical protein SK128_007767 [Halocaridina rubra]